MCARITILTYDEVLDALQSIRSERVANPFPDWPATRPRADAFPQSPVPLAVPSHAGGGIESLEVRVLSWGYPVSWQPSVVFNTRIESILQGSKLWRESAETRRCLVPTIRFYERHGSESARNPKTGRMARRHYEFSLADEPITWLAGIYEDDHFSVVTTAPNAAVAPVHNRMPLALRQRELSTWLDQDYAQLADRSSIVLSSAPEQLPPADNENEQLSLF